VELMRRVCWDIDCLTRPHDAFRATEGGLKFAFKHDESFFEVVTVWRWSATRGYMHVDETKVACSVFTGEKDGVRISNHSNVRKFLIGVWLHDCEIPFKIVGW
jgi:hypothetical protein